MRAKLLIEKALKQKAFVGALMQSSLNNREYASYRLSEYLKAYSNQEAYERTSLERMFSALPGTATTRGFPNYGVVLQLASLLANVSSFSGFLTIEKTIEQPNFVLHFLDLIGTNVRDREQSSPIFPTVGPTRYDNSAYGLQTYVTTAPGTSINIDDDTFRNAAGIPLLPSPPPVPPIMPYTIKIVVKAYDSAGQLLANEVFTDNGNRILVNLGLSGGQITITSPTPHISTYGNPSLPPNQPGWAFTVGSTPITIASSVSGTSRLDVELVFAFNYTEPIYYPGQEQDERFTLSLTRVVTVNTKPAKITIELNKQELAAISKSMSQDLQPVIVQRVGEIYNKMVNRYIVRKYVQRFIDTVNFSNVVIIDLGSPLGGPAGTALVPYSSWDQYIPILDRMRGGFEKVRQELHRKSYIANKPTALLVSPQLAYFLAKSIMVEQSLFVEEKVTYINDLFGYYIGIPVLVHTELEALDMAFETWARQSGLTPPRPMDGASDYVTAAIGFAVAVLPDNNLAPMVRATFLPPTNTPTVANFNNPLQEAFSMFYQEEVDVVAPELVVPFGVTNMPKA
jgi:hypothetical protein